MTPYHITAKIDASPGLRIEKVIYADTPEEAEKKFYDEVESECYIVDISPQ